MLPNRKGSQDWYININYLPYTYFCYIFFRLLHEFPLTFNELFETHEVEANIFCVQKYSVFLSPCLVLELCFLLICFKRSLWCMMKVNFLNKISVAVDNGLSLSF